MSENDEATVGEVVGAAEGLPVEVTSTSWQPKRELTVDEWRAVGGELGQSARAVQWWVGDWINYGDKIYGSTYEAALEVTGLSLKTLQNYASVSRKVESSRRRELLDWTTHAEVAALEPAEQDRVLSEAEAQGLSKREVRQLVKRPIKTEKPILPAGEFDVVYADPPWHYEMAPSNSRAIENHYPTMSDEEIKSLRVPAAPDAYLFLWATSTKLQLAFDVIEAWGFMYRSNIVWVKDRIGMGYWTRGRHEFLLIASRGKVSHPDFGTQPDSVLEAPRGEHSQKPDRAYDLVEQMTPNAEARLELFARRQRDGWTAWGNQV